MPRALFMVDPAVFPLSNEQKKAVSQAVMRTIASHTGRQVQEIEAIWIVPDYTVNALPLNVDIETEFSNSSLSEWPAAKASRLQEAVLAELCTALQKTWAPEKAEVGVWVRGFAVTSFGLKPVGHPNYHLP